MAGRRLGESEIQVPKVIFGAWGIGGGYWGSTDDGAAVAAIRASMDAGIWAIDTAPMYGRGHSEMLVGEAIRGRRDEVLLLTKVGLRWDDPRGAHFFDGRDPASGEEFSVYRNLRPDSVRIELERSLERLGVDQVDLLQCHWPDPTTPVEETMDAMADLVDEGLVRAVGVSNFSPALLERCARHLKARGGSVPLASNQPPYSLLNRDAEGDVLKWGRRNRVGSIVYSPLEQGLLTGKVTMDRVIPEDDGRHHHPLFQPDNRRKILAAVGQARELADAHGCSLAQLALAWCVHRPGVTAAIAGARTPAQAVENAGACDVSLSAQEVEMLAALFGALDLER